MSKKLTAKQRRFVEEYLVDLNATQAAIRAGYSEKTAEVQGSRLLSNAKVAEAIAQAQDKRSERTEITQDRVLEELAKIGFASMGNYLHITREGDPMIDLSEMTPEQAAAISEATLEDFTEGRGEDARDVRRIKIKLHDKKGALVDIGRHLGMFPNKHEHSGPGGGPIKSQDVTTSEEDLIAECQRLGIDPASVGLADQEET